MTIIGLLSLSAIFFLLFWILGGVVYAIASFTFVRKMRATLFSSLFTVACGVIALGSAALGLALAKPSVEVCDLSTTSSVDALVDSVACGMTAYTLAGVGGLIVTLIVGGVLLKLCIKKSTGGEHGRIAQLVRASH